MISPGLQHLGVIVMLILAVVTFPALFFITAPYGRHLREGWGPTVAPRVGWVLMESPSVLLFSLIFTLGPNRAQLVPWVLFLLWQTHYVHRTLIYPFSLPPQGKRMPVFVVLSGFAFNLLNSVVNGGWVGCVGVYSRDWLWDPRFLLGTMIFGVGLVMNRRADSALRRLRAPGEKGYKIPHGGMYEWISCPNYLGEIVEWTGWAILTWSWAGLAFAIYSVANLAPRALSHHAWYRDHFAEYPRERKALLPLLL